MTTPLLGRPRARTLFAGAAAALATVVAAAPATAADVTAGSLEWETANVYQTPAGTPPDPTNRTWLGYVTNSPAPMGANGTATPSDGATGATVTPASPRTADDWYSWVYSAGRGSYEPADGTGTISFDGTVTFASPTPPAGHGFTITVEDPRVVLDGERGQLFASGLNSDRATGSYTQATPLFDLDLSQSFVALHADGSRTIGGIVPSIATANTAFPGNYRVGAGPDRTPNTFGNFSIRVKTAPVHGPKGDKGDKGDTGAPGAKGDTGATGPAGRNGTNGSNGRDGTTTIVRIQTTSLATAPFSGRASRKVRVTARRGNRTLATGTVKGKRLSITIARGVKAKQLKGRYLLRLTGRNRGSAVVRLP